MLAMTAVVEAGGAEWLATYSAARSTPQLTTRAERGLIGKPDELPADSATGTSTVGPLMVKSAAQPSCRLLAILAARIVWLTQQSSMEVKTQGTRSVVWHRQEHWRRERCE